MPDKRRLLVVSHGFPPYYGGAEHAAGHLAAAAVSSGRWEVDVLTSDIGGRLPARERWRGVNVVRVPARKKKWANHNVVELHSFLRSASRNMEIRRPDWILAHFTLPGGEVARRWAGRFGIPYAVVLHGADVPDSQKGRFGAVYPLIKPLVRRVWRQAARVIAVSDGLRELALRTWPEGRIEVVPNGVDIERFRPAEMPTVRDGGTLVVVAVARLVEIKGLQHLIAALARIPADMRSQIRLRLCGTGPYEGELRRQVREAGLDAQVEFAGLVPYERIPEEFQGADMFALPSLQEGLPLSLLEAMACGLPVMASRVGGVPAVICDGENGFLIPAGDVEKVSKAIVQLASDSILRARVSKAARHTAQSWSWDSIWERYEALLTGACRTAQGADPCG
jgi:glycosyltransferase involved in cell wall biosynthesis